MLDTLPTDVPVSLLAWLAGGFVTLLGALARIIWRRQGKDMEAINADVEAINNRLSETVSKATYEQHRKEIRDDVSALHRRIEATDERAQARHTIVMEALLGLAKR